MTLFDIVSPDEVFAMVLAKYYDGKADKRTITIINKEVNETD